jgi:hypothetical protein
MNISAFGARITLCDGGSVVESVLTYRKIRLAEGRSAR